MRSRRSRRVSPRLRADAPSHSIMESRELGSGPGPEVVSASTTSRLNPGLGRRPDANSTSKERAARSAGDPSTGAPNLSARTRRRLRSSGALARRDASSSTSSFKARNVAKLRVLGPAGVVVDSRISKRPRGLLTTYAIVGNIPTSAEVLVRTCGEEGPGAQESTGLTGCCKHNDRRGPGDRPCG